MRPLLKRTLKLLMIISVGILIGLVISKKKNFIINKSKTIFSDGKDLHSSRWSIGIVEGDSPFTLKERRNTNPILCAKDISEIKTDFVADPFIFFENGKYYLFFEMLNIESQQGDIALAESEDGVNWEYKQVIINEDFHLSYPQIFKMDSSYYIIPESNIDLSIRLYKARHFPSTWEYVGNIMAGHEFNDPTIFYYENKWWIFASNPNSDVLNLYYSDSLRGAWTFHPQNPICKNSRHFARPAGNVFNFENNLYRLALDDAPYYGIQVFAFKITELTDSTYKEVMITKPIIKKSGKGWNAFGMHHISFLTIDQKWIGFVDGRGY